MVVHVRAYAQRRDDQIVHVSEHVRGDPPHGSSPQRSRHQPRRLPDVSRVPDYKRYVFRNWNPKRTWEGFQEALRKHSGLGETQRFVFGEIFGAEGGIKEAPGGSASSGIMVETLQAVQRVLPDDQELGSVNRPINLTFDQRVKVYEHDLGVRLRGLGGVKGLADLGDPFMAAALSDSLFRHGRKGGSFLVQLALNKVRFRRNEPSITPDGGPGPEMLEALLVTAADTEAANEFLDELAELRKQKEPGEADRMEHFRFLEFR